jgi:hypothetical protein
VTAEILKRQAQAAAAVERAQAERVKAAKLKEAEEEVERTRVKFLQTLLLDGEAERAAERKRIMEDLRAKIFDTIQEATLIRNVPKSFDSMDKYLKM